MSLFNTLAIWLTVREQNILFLIVIVVDFESLASYFAANTSLTVFVVLLFLWTKVRRTFWVETEAYQWIHCWSKTFQRALTLNCFFYSINVIIKPVRLGYVTDYSEPNNDEHHWRRFCTKCMSPNCLYILRSLELKNASSINQKI